MSYTAEEQNNPERLDMLREGTIKRIHVSQANLRKNYKEGTDLPIYTIQTSKGPLKAHEVSIKGEGIFVNGFHDPLPCGARVWFETAAKIEIKVREHEEALSVG